MHGIVYLIGGLLLINQAPAPALLADPYVALLDEARAAPVEIFADVAFRLSGKLPRKAKAAALEEIFRRAGEARLPWPLERAVLSSSDRAIVMEYAYFLGLDALSLRCRAVEGLLAIDPRLARELFEQIPRLEIPRTECDSDFVPDAGIYIRTLALVAGRGAFTPEERAKQAPWFLVERGARGVSSSWEIVAAAKGLPRFARTEKETGILSAALAAALSVSDSDRAYTSAARRGGLVRAVLAAGDKLKTGGAVDPAILAALRAYLVRHLAATRCEDFFAPPHGGWLPGQVDTVVGALPLLEGFAAFNDAVRGRTDIPPISREESKPAGLEGRADRGEYANGAAYRALMSEIAGLGKLRDENDPTAEWSFRMRQALTKIDDFKGAPDQDALEVFHQKCSLLSSLARAAAGGGDIGLPAMNARIALLEDPLIPGRSPPEWLVEVRRFLAERRTYTYVHTALDAKVPVTTRVTGAEIPGLCAASRSPALSLYGRLALLDAGHGAGGQ